MSKNKGRGVIAIVLAAFSGFGLVAGAGLASASSLAVDGGTLQHWEFPAGIAEDDSTSADAVREDVAEESTEEGNADGSDAAANEEPAPAPGEPEG